MARQIIGLTSGQSGRQVPCGNWPVDIETVRADLGFGDGLDQSSPTGSGVGRVVVDGYSSGLCIADSLLASEIEGSTVGDGEDFVPKICAGRASLVEDFVLVEAVVTYRSLRTGKHGRGRLASSTHSRHRQGRDIRIGCPEVSGERHRWGCSCR